MKENFNGDFDKDYDLVVMGTGPGGATVAREMANRGKKVLMLEQGPHREPDGSIISAAIDMMLPGKGLYFTPQIAGVVRACCTGGSSLYYYGSALHPDLDKFKRHGIDLKYDTDEMYKDLNFLQPLKDYMISDMSKAIMEGARSLGHDWNPIQKFIIQDKWTPDYSFSCSDPRDIKWSALMYVREAMQKGAKLLNHAKVTNVLLENKKAVGLEFKLKGQLQKVYAKTVVLSGGGMSTPFILKKLGVKGVGENYFFDPFINVVGEHPTLTRNREIPMSTGLYFKDDGYVMTDLQIPSNIQETIFAAQVGHLNHPFRYNRSGSIMVKTKDSLGGVLAPGGWPIKLLTTADRKRMKEGTSRAKEIMQKAGFQNIYKTYYFAAHPGGTVAVGKFLDSNLKTQFDNLYVCDSSVIPDGCGVPPVTMIIALGKYLARGLAGERK
jgi:choline dehydrogenase-like flavoprotein